MPDSPESAQNSTPELPISLELVLDPTVNFAMQQNDVPVVKSLKIINQSEIEVRDLQVRVWSEPDFALPWEARVASVAPRGTYDLGVVDLELSPGFLLELKERMAGLVHAEVRCEDQALVNTNERIDILAHDEWSGLRSLPEILAAFVLPNHPEVERLLANAAQLLGEWTEDSSLSGYQSKSPERVLRIAAAIYAVLQGQGLNYINPPASFEQNGQKIRLPHRIFENKMGTCLDLAVLFAACLEQVGLFPLVVITEGHAFTGVWLENQCFAESASDDGLRLKKRVDLEEICVFETTTLTGKALANFDQAVVLGKRHLEELKEFRCAIDIQRCRKSRIRPLPIHAAGAAAEIASVTLQDKAQTPDKPGAPDLSGFGRAKPVATPNIIDEQAQETPTTRLDKWKRRLLDLTLRNRLINFRETRKTLPILCPDLASLEDALADGEKFKVYERPVDMADGHPRNSELHLQRTGQDPLNELLKAEFLARRLRADVTKNDLDRRMLEIYRDARNSLEEGGANTLYVALGFLSWYETGSSQQQRLAPIILIPVELERGSVQEGFRIRQGDEEPRINTTLMELLAKDFELKIPISDPLPMDDHGINVRGILNSFKHAIKDIDRWEVIEKAQIGLFSFTKYLMWRDLQMRTDDLMKNKVVAHLINRPTEPFPVEGEFPDPDRLDIAYKTEETFCPLDSDSSQLAAVYAAAEGKSFVLEGPPGTGKSQTIANMIAHCLAAGKTVLFVSEKMAALNVVHSRLKKIGLAPFCLELHSNKSHKLEVIQQLGQSLERVGQHSSENWQREAIRLASLRSDLNRYVQALHQKRETGESLFQGISRLIGLRDTNPVDLDWPAGQHMNRDRLEHMREIIERLCVATKSSDHPCRSIWKTTDYQDWNPALEREIQGLLESVANACNRLRQAAHEAAPLLGMEQSDGSCQTYDIAAEVASALLIMLPAMTPALLCEPDWAAIENSVQEWIRRGQRRYSLRRAVFERFTERVLDLNLEEILQNTVANSAIWLKQDALARFEGGGGEQGWVGWLEVEVQALMRQFAICCDKLLEKSLPIAPLLGLAQSDWSLPVYAYVDELAGIFLNIPAALPSALLTESDWETTRHNIQKWVEHGHTRDALRKTLYERYTDQILKLDLDRLRQKLTTANASWFLPRFLGRMSVKKAIKTVTRSGQLPALEEIINDLDQALSLRTEENILKAADEQAEILLGFHWNKSEADWQTIERLVACCTSIRNMVAKATVNNPEKSAALRGQWVKVLSEGHDRLTGEGDLGQMLLGMRQAFSAFIGAKMALEAKLHQDQGNLWGDVKQSGLMGRIHGLLSAWESQIAVFCSIRDSAKSGRMPTWENLPADLKCAIDLRAEEKAIASISEQANELLGENWRCGEADWNLIEKILGQARHLRDLSKRVGNSIPERATAIRSIWARLINEGKARLAPEGVTGRRFVEMKDAHACFHQKLRDLNSMLSLNSDSAWSSPSEPEWLDRVLAGINEWQEHLPSFRAWCYWRSIRKQAIDGSLGSIISAYENGTVTYDTFSPSFERSYYQWWVEQTTQADPVLRGFFSPEFERKIQQFREIDERYTSLTRLEVQARLAANIPLIPDSANPNSEMGILRRQIHRQRGHMPVRQLVQKIPNLLPRLKPCLLMSPISVAQYLDAAQTPFDLVIFDEASQIPVWDAVGAIARGSEAVIVGDPKQLPPTNFFGRVDEQEIAEDDVAEDLESILDDCIASQLPWLQLRWHYRSRHESLIAFSNYQYYENRLLTFPSPHRDTGVSLRMVRGLYDKGKSRTNRAEAEAVVAEIVRRLTDSKLSRHSIGVVTFSISQQILIEDMLEIARREHPEVENFFSYEESLEPVFVKNLENVQGDERDVILFSICYGPDVEGRPVSMNFGPLNRDGGERRLNVAITRARQEVCVFSTLKADQIDLARTRARGVRDLKCFLDYAEHGPVAIAEAISVRAGDEFDSPFEKQVCELLRRRGYEVHAQVGCSGYRIDLAIVDSETPGRYLLGIECDGANYHRARTARDRDRLREAILRDLGWQLHRIWSTDWWANQQRELDRIEVAIENARKKHTSFRDMEIEVSDSIESVEVQEPSKICAIVQPVLSTMPEMAVQTKESAFTTYMPYLATQILGDPDDFYSPSAVKKLQLNLMAIVDTEGPISFNMLSRRVAACWEIKKVNRNVQNRIIEVTRMANMKSVKHGREIFFWPSACSPEEYTDFRVPGGDAGSQRDSSDLPPEEIANAAFQILEQMISLPMDDLVRETARLFGFQRTGLNVEKCMLRGIKILLQRGVAIEREGMVIHNQ